MRDSRGGRDVAVVRALAVRSAGSEPESGSRGAKLHGCGGGARLGSVLGVTVTHHAYSTHTLKLILNLKKSRSLLGDLINSSALKIAIVLKSTSYFH